LHLFLWWYPKLCGRLLFLSQEIYTICGIAPVPIVEGKLWQDDMETGPLVAGAIYASQPIWGQSPLAAPTINAAGGFVDYQPATTLASGETLIIQLTKF
jgi:hypothetical protein